MPRTIDGTYSLPAGTLVTSGETILVSQHNPAMQDLAAGLTSSLSRAGQGGMQAPLSMGGFKVTNAAPGTNAADLVTVGQLPNLLSLGVYGTVPNVQIGVQTDQAPLINAALASSTASNVILPSGVIWIGQSVVVPANKILVMQTNTILRALPSFATVSGNNAGVTLAGSRASLVGGAVDMNKLGVGGARKNGVTVLNGVRDAVKRDIVIMNCSGYGNYTAGADNFATPPSSYSENVTTLNCQVHHESQASDGDVYYNCHASDGDGDIPCGSFFHPLAGTRNCRFTDCVAIGVAGAGAEITTNVNPLANITFTNCDITITSGVVAAIVIPSDFNLGITGLHFIGGTYKTPGIAAVIRYATEAMFTGVTLIGYQGMESTNSEVDCTGCHVVAGTDPMGAQTAFGVTAAGTGAVRWNGGEILVTGPVGSAATNGAVRVSADTRQVPLPPASFVTKNEAIGRAAIQNDGVNCFANVSLLYDNIANVHMDLSIIKTTDGYIPAPIAMSWALIDAPNKIIRVRIWNANLATGYLLGWHMIEKA